MRKQSFLLIPAAVLSIGLSSAGVQAASSCTALTEQRQCAADTGCRWVGGYQRKDGIDVRAHCRSRGGGDKGVAADRRDAAADSATPSR